MNDEDEEQEDVILSEIRRFREEHARAQNYNVHALFEEMRRDTARLEAEGWKVVDFSKKPSAALVREDPPR
jgi:phosphoglycolate phosphatase-like HAD superfamily hydrolase